MENNCPSLVPVPLQPLPAEAREERRLWVGNLDLRVTEYNLLKLLQRHGSICKLDFLFHRTGALAGQPRGYAFVTYERREDALSAVQALDGTCLMGRRVAVRWASVMVTDELERPKQQFHIPALAGANQKKATLTRKSRIQAIEEKLRNMERDSGPEFQLSSARGHVREGGGAATTSSSSVSSSSYQPRVNISSTVGASHQLRRNIDAAGRHSGGRQHNQHRPYHKPSTRNHR